MNLTRPIRNSIFAILNLVALFLSLTLPAFSQGTILWNENVNGPFSFDYQNPTTLGGLSSGTNSILGATEVEPTGKDWFGHADFFTIQVPNNSMITAIYLQVDKPNVWSWIGNTDYSVELSYSINSSTGNLLSQWSLVSVGNGIYGMYLENHDHQGGTSIATYRLDFVVQSVPEPATLSLVVIGALFLPLIRAIRVWQSGRHLR